MCGPLVWVACERGQTNGSRTTSTASTTEAPGSSGGTTVSPLTGAPAAATPDPGQSAAPEVAPIPAEFVGVWRGQGTARAVKLELPGNQGVQLAWVQDKGTTHVGAVTLLVEITKDGAVQGSLNGGLGELAVAGNWDGVSPLHAELVPKVKAPEAFGGLLTLVLAEHSTTAEGSLRVVSHDGKWVREAPVALSLNR